MWRKLTSALAITGLVGLAVYPAFAQVPQFEPGGSHWDIRDDVGDEVTWEITASYQNYFDGTEWKDTDRTLVFESNKWKMETAPFHLEIPQRANGQMKFTDRHQFNLDGQKNTPVTQDPISKVRTFTDANNTIGTVIENGVEYAGAIPNTDALIVEIDLDSVRYMLRWDSRPAICDTQSTFDINFRDQGDAGLVPRKFGNQLVNTDFEVLHGFHFSAGDRSITTPIAIIWDSDGKLEEVEVQGKWNPASFTGKKVIDCSFFDDATFPVFADDESTFNSASGNAQDYDGHYTNTATPQDWATTRNAASSSSVTATSTELNVQSQSSAGDDYQISRVIVQFPTGTLDDDITITAATLKPTVTATLVDGDNDGTDYLAVVVSTPASTSSIAADDYDQCGTTLFSDEIDLNTLSTETQFTMTLNATGIADINLTGTTSWCIREGHDIENEVIVTTQNNNAGLDSADAASGDPILTVTFTAAASFPGHPVIVTYSNFVDLLKDYLHKFIPTVYAE